MSSGPGRPKISRQVLSLCLIIFLADVVAGIIIPTFSLYATSLGVSLALLGVLNTTGGLVQLVSSMPFGVLSDRIGRSWILGGGLIAFTVSVASFALAEGPTLLFVGRIMFGLAGVATFQIGAARLGDITTEEERPIAFGLYATAMGLGFTVGPLIGGQMSQRFGYESAYFVGLFISLLALLVAGMTLPRKMVENTYPRVVRIAGRSRQDIRQILRHRDLMVVTFGNMLVSLTFAGAITTFFPIYGKDILLTQGAIGTMFAVRAVVSTLGRIPNGIISRRLGNKAVLFGALLLNTSVMFAIAMTKDTAMLTVLLGIEGLAFGAYLVSGQTYVANNTTVRNRGTAIGMYSTAASLGGTIAPIALGIVANVWGVAMVFTVTGWILVIGTGITAIGMFGFRRGSLDSGHVTSDLSQAPSSHSPVSQLRKAQLSEAGERTPD
mgnify:CR=1 FL=1